MHVAKWALIYRTATLGLVVLAVGCSGTDATTASLLAKRASMECGEGEYVTAPTGVAVATPVTHTSTSIVCDGGGGGNPQGSFSQADYSLYETNPEGYPLSGTPGVTILIGTSSAMIEQKSGYTWPHVATVSATTTILNGTGLAYLSGEAYVDRGWQATMLPFDKRELHGTGWSNQISGDCTQYEMSAEVLSDHRARFLTFGLSGSTYDRATCVYRSDPGGGGGTKSREGCHFIGWIEISKDNGQTWVKIAPVYECDALE